jgi:hypothetical protein
MDESRGVVFIAFGAAYRNEAKAALGSLLRNSPGLLTAVITEEPWKETPQPDLFVQRPPEMSLRCKPLYLFEASPFEHTLFLDTDTFVARPLQLVFGLLGHYDLGVCFEGPRLGWPPGLEYHSQANTGVILFKRNHAVREMFQGWLEEYDRTLQAAKPVLSGKGMNDQRSFCVALAMSRVRAVHLPEFMNFVLWHVSKTYNRPAVFHGRLRHVESLDHEISGGWEDDIEDVRVRAWLPHIEGILPGAGVGRRDPLLLAAITFRRWWNRSARAWRHRKRGSRAECG